MGMTSSSSPTSGGLLADLSRPKVSYQKTCGSVAFTKCPRQLLFFGQPMWLPQLNAALWVPIEISRRQRQSHQLVGEVFRRSSAAVATSREGQRPPSLS